MNELHIDLETRSGYDLSVSGGYKYTESPEFEILLFGYSVDGAPAKVVDLKNGEMIPDEIYKAITDNSVTKFAHNASFERVCLSRYMGYPTGEYLDPSSWRCTMVWGAYLSLPLKLADMGEVLKLDKQKLREGDKLIKTFCIKHKDKGFISPKDAPEEWELFKKYNQRDVDAEVEIHRKLQKYPMPESEWDNYHLDQKINDRGILIDDVFAARTIDINNKLKDVLLSEAKAITGLDNPNSVSQLIDWLESKEIFVDSLNKENVGKLIDETTGDVKRALELRQQLSKSSVKKYEAMLNVMCSDNRVRGLIQFYGANRTGRFSGRLVQVQNLPQNHLENLEDVRALVKGSSFEELNTQFDSLSSVLSELIRTAFVPKPGCRFYVADFSAIEARVIAWFAGEQWRMDAFAQGKDIYCASASQMFHVPVEKNGINSHLRAKGKIAELALGYGGSVGALVSMGALEKGLKEEELADLVSAWRKSNPRIVKFWWDVDAAIVHVVETHRAVRCHNLIIGFKDNKLFIKLLSGRKLWYINPYIDDSSSWRPNVAYKGIGANKKWIDISSYGPKFVENIVQATARDLLVEAMQRLESKGYRIVMHVHDEVVIEAESSASLEDICNVMAEIPEWGEGLLLRADGYVCDFYKKD